MQTYQHIGAILAAARAEHLLSIAEVAAALHIRPRYIEALEQGDMGGIPNLTYAKGYLRRYALYLSLDVAEIMRRFEVVAEGQGVAFFMPHTFSRDKHVHPQIVAMCMAGLLLFFLVWAVFIRAPQAELVLVEPVPEKVMAPEPVQIPAQTVQQSPCLQTQTTLYPPCYWPISAPQESILWKMKP